MAAKSQSQSQFRLGDVFNLIVMNVVVYVLVWHTWGWLSCVALLFVSLGGGYYLNVLDTKAQQVREALDETAKDLRQARRDMDETMRNFDVRR